MNCRRVLVDLNAKRSRQARHPDTASRDGWTDDDPHLPTSIALSFQFVSMAELFSIFLHNLGTIVQLVPLIQNRKSLKWPRESLWLHSDY